MGKHMWVEIKYTLIEPELVSEGRIDIHATEGQIELADHDVAYGCWLCSAALTGETIDEECPGGSNERI